MDDYDYVQHTDTFDSTLHIYSNDVIEDQIRAFLVPPMSNWVLKEMSTCITKMQGALSALDGRYITCMGSRFCHYVRSDEPPVWYLIQVWRSENPQNTIVGPDQT